MLKRKVLLFLAMSVSVLVLLSASLAFAAVYYVSPSGNDSNAGTISAPLKSIAKAQSKASSGDTVYLRGGTYSSFSIMSYDSNYNYVHEISKSGITYEAYPGETPIFNFSSISTSRRVAAFHIAKGVSGVTFRGFKVTGVPVGSQKQSECFRIEGNATFDRMTAYNNAANGFYFTGKSASGSCINCDSYNNKGTSSTSVGNTDGFGAHGGDVTFYGCRAWSCSDDGFDAIASYGKVTFDHCWAYDMNYGGDSSGFKVGGWGTMTPPSSVPSHVVKYCLSAKNGAHGFYANHHPGKAADWTYNTAYGNASSNYNMLERVSTTNSTDISGTREVLHYNVAYQGTTIKNANLSSSKVSNNSWTISGVSVTSGDFKSTDASKIKSSRKSDGSLPDITFMKPASGSDIGHLGCFASSSSSSSSSTSTSSSSSSTSSTSSSSTSSSSSSSTSSTSSSSSSSGWWTSTSSTSSSGWWSSTSSTSSSSSSTSSTSSGWWSSSSGWWM